MMKCNQFLSFSVFYTYLQQLKLPEPPAMQFHVGSQQDYKLEVSHNRRYSPSHAGSHEKGKKASISPPCSRRTLRCIQLQDPIDQSQQLGNRTTADQLLLSMRASGEDKDAFCTGEQKADATAGQRQQSNFHAQTMRSGIFRLFWNN